MLSWVPCQLPLAALPAPIPTANLPGWARLPGSVLDNVATCQAGLQACRETQKRVWGKHMCVSKLLTS